MFGVTPWWIGCAHLLQSRVDEAIMWFEKARSEEAGLACVHAYLPSAYALEGERERAAAELAEARRPNGDLYSSIAQLKGGGSRVVPKIRAP